jgi:hypothetical protein
MSLSWFADTAQNQAQIPGKIMSDQNSGILSFFNRELVPGKARISWVDSKKCTAVVLEWPSKRVHIKTGKKATKKFCSSLKNPLEAHILSS